MRRRQIEIFFAHTVIILFIVVSGICLKLNINVLKTNSLQNYKKLRIQEWKPTAGKYPHFI
jgi:hypothetical protein